MGNRKSLAYSAAGCYGKSMFCTILGGGVSGLSTGIRLLERGLEVRLVAEKMSPETVSDTAAAWWYPFLVEPLIKTNRWSSESFREFIRLMEQEGLEFITMRMGREYLKQPCRSPGWSESIDHFRILEEHEVVDGYSFGWEIEAPVIEMAHYMPWLKSRFKSLGGTIETRKLSSFNELESELIVNCSGLGAREICQDEEVVPVRGQVVYIRQDPGFGRYDQRPESLIYTIPRRDVTVLGGTAQKGDWTMEIREDDEEYILKKCESLWPELDRSNIVGRAVGLRPSRTEVRLEKEHVGDKVIVHNYGHGGAGVTLSWGCAGEVARLMGR
ncbi:MAG: FAD-binding oxidoreductase [Euryarchaeota archaeon TMED192]|nr:MAG: FAD-binding oxidoreductase [Euryarchaeota archaeon TMED192]